MTKAELIAHVRTNPINATLLDRLPELGLADVWLVSGALFQTAWNGLTKRPPTYGINDYDIAYFDSRDLSWQAEDRVIRRTLAAFKDLNVKIEVRNQARVHLWYSKKYGLPYAPLTSASESIDRYMAVVSRVGLKPRVDGGCELYAPQGLDDLTKLIVRPHKSPNFSPPLYQQKASRWQRLWPELEVIGADL